MRILVNLLLFQSGWFVVVLAAANQLEIVAVLVVFNILVIHLFLVGDYKAEIILIVISGSIGFIVDTLNITYGVFSAVGEIALGKTAPLWLVGLWMLFAMTVNHSLSWLKGRYLVAAMSGFVFAPVAYYAGHRLGAIIMPGHFLPYVTMLIIGVAWAIIMPVLLAIAAHLNQRQKAES